MADSQVSIPILVVGAGAWGTALAIQLGTRAEPGAVVLYARDGEQAHLLHTARNNEKYLPGIAFPDTLEIANDLSQACRHWRTASRKHQQQFPQAGSHGLIILATPMSGLEAASNAVREALGAADLGEGVVWLSKGLRFQGQASLGFEWPSQIVARCCPDWPIGALSGPSFAQEVAVGLPAALTLSSKDLQWARALAQELHGGGLRIYVTDDLIGVELGGAMKNVLAIAAGVCDGLQLGANARAALLTRGLAEMSRLGLALGAQAQTFIGLATLGDLILTATGDLSRNRRVGLGLAKGQTVAQVMKTLGHVAEGVPTAPALLALAQQHDVDVPITESVCRLLEGQWSAREAIAQLMSREPRDERLV
jgi:glycerol-3-phosphate dehydrogenase (NAD(P)+)